MSRSSFNVQNLPSSPNYPSLELRLGAGIVKPLGRFFELRSGLNLGLKVKRESYFFGSTKQFTKEPAVILKLDEAASNRNHFVVDMPLLLQVNLRQSRLGFKAGFNGRFWAPNNDDVDVLTNRFEIGTLAGIMYRLTPRINTSFDFYYGLSDIYGGSIFSPAPPINFYVRNQFAQLIFEYSL